MKEKEGEQVERKAAARRSKTRYLALAGAFTALTFVVTLFLNIPAAFILGAGGNINLGDAVILAAASVLGPFGGAAAGALGAGLADVVGGYIVYAPATVLIKAAEGFLFGFFLHRPDGSADLPIRMGGAPGFLRTALAFALSSFTLVVGYFFAEAVLLSVGGLTDPAVVWLGAARTLVPNLVQVAVSGAMALPLSRRLKKLKSFL
ncbi:MAG: ECF transporter S component [Clostridiales bacterium]|jgi:uncharacterized membrane protein|nr:ECF transporter S component [Clostridiales bacterium]